MFKPFLLYTAPSPNRHKVSVFLEHSLSVERINISTNVQKEPWLYPVLVDRSRDNFVIFETAAILVYLAQDPQVKLYENRENEMLQWIFFAHGGVGPMQSNHFRRAAPEDIPYAKKRTPGHAFCAPWIILSVQGARRRPRVEIRLQDRLAGPGRGKISITDFNDALWVSASLGPASKPVWLERILDRTAVQAGIAVPA
ncbi:glutathione S-transferase [Mycena sanguinolenta]|nr:glutathione S-transferase [Mycena sanguinolenta]